MALRPTQLLLGAHCPGLQQLEFEMQHFAVSIVHLILRKECCCYGNSVAVHSSIVLAVHVHYKLQV